MAVESDEDLCPSWAKLAIYPRYSYIGGSFRTPGSPIPVNPTGLQADAYAYTKGWKILKEASGSWATHLYSQEGRRRIFTAPKSRFFWTATCGWKGTAHGGSGFTKNIYRGRKRRGHENIIYRVKTIIGTGEEAVLVTIASSGSTPRKPIPDAGKEGRVHRRNQWAGAVEYQAIQAARPWRTRASLPKASHLPGTRWRYRNGVRRKCGGNFQYIRPGRPGADRFLRPGPGCLSQRMRQLTHTGYHRRDMH